MSFAQFGLSRMSSPEEPAGTMVDVLRVRAVDACFFVFVFFSQDWQPSILCHTSPLHAEISPSVCRPSYRA